MGPLTMIVVGAVAVAALVWWLTARSDTPPDLAASPIEARVSASLLVDSEPVGATVWVQGDSVGVTPAWVTDIEPGVVEVEIWSEWGAHDTTLALRAGQDESILVWLDTAFPADAPGIEAQSIEERPGETADAATSSDPQPDPRQANSEPPARSESPQAPSAPETGGLQIQTVPEGATVWIDREEMGRTPLTLATVPVGEQVVDVRAPGFEPERLRVTVAAGELATRSIELRARPGIVTFTAASGSRVFVDGTLRGAIRGDPLRIPLAGGRHEVRVFHPELGEEYRVIDVSAGAALRVAIDPPESWDGGADSRSEQQAPRRRAW